MDGKIENLDPIQRSIKHEYWTCVTATIFVLYFENLKNGVLLWCDIVHSSAWKYSWNVFERLNCIVAQLKIAIQ